MIALGICGFGLSARADIFMPNFPVIETHSTGAGNTSGSFAASAMMGAKGHSNQPLLANWEASITGLCATQTGASPWPGSCNPTGMASALHNLTGRSWVQFTWAATDQVSALNEVVASLQTWHSPAVVPIYGQADHWVAINQVTATANGSGWTIGNVLFFDGGPPGGQDSGTNGYTGGQLSYNGNIFKNVYFMVISNIGGCDPCVSDPFYNRYVLMWEPPVDQMHTHIVTNFARAPGVSQGMSEKLAQSLVWKALSTGGVNEEPGIWNAISGGTAGTAFEVNGVFPTGDRWDYFLVPILSAANTVTAFVQLAADDGSFESVHVLPTPIQFNPVTKARAELLARGTLQVGESLTSGILTWDPKSNTPFVKAPTFPYYEFGVVNRAKEIGVVRVSLNTGAVIRTP
jgi:hypothetical protein